MPFAVLLTNAAERDMEELYEFLLLHDAPEKAEYVLGQIEKALTSLAESPHRGVYPKELVALGIRDFREIFFKPYRIIYRIMNNDVYVFLVTDDRRDMQTLLQRRLLQD